MIEQLLEQAVNDGIIKCQFCGNQIEPDCPMCHCGWKNSLVGEGWI